MRADPILTLCAVILIALLMFAAATMEPHGPEPLGLF